MVSLFQWWAINTGKQWCAQIIACLFDKQPPAAPNPQDPRQAKDPESLIDRCMPFPIHSQAAKRSGLL